LDIDLAGDGVEAIEALLRTEYALVLMDCKMPVMDGLEATKRIRGSDFLGSNQGIPIIAITADAFQTNHKQCIAAGMDDWVTKPISGTELTQVVQKWLPLALSRRGR
jgi:CheY-like chemotaxis protein